MPDRDAVGPIAPLPTWRPAKVVHAQTEQRLFCGDGPPRPSVDEAFEEMRALKKEWDERKEREQAEEKKVKQKEAKRKKAEEDDDTKAVERYRNNRYSVELLQQADNAWGGGGGDQRVLG